MRIYKVLSALLEYPEQELVDNLPEIRAIVDGSSELDSEEKLGVLKFIDNLTNISLTEAQVEYVDTFDRIPEHSLHLTHHLFGDDSDRDRGPALIDLGEMFKDYGVKTVTNELPFFRSLATENAAVCTFDAVV